MLAVGLPMETDGSTAKVTMLGHRLALIEGKTVCSGYAMAYEALCDYLDLECYVIVGEQGGEGHAWNMVKIDGEKYYVDCSFADTGGGSKYCLFDGKTYKREGYKAESGFDMAEQW